MICERQISTGGIFSYIFLGKFLEKTNWYVIELVIFYLLFYVLYHKMKVKHANIGMILIAIAGIILGYYFGYRHAWIMSSISFPIGIIYQQHESPINRVIRNYRLVILFIMVIICAGCYLISGISTVPSIVQDGLLKNIACIGFCVIVLEMADTVPIKNRITLFLGSISFEIYLVHIVHWIYFPNLIEIN